MKVYYKATVTQLTIHHYKAGTTEKIVDDEVLTVVIGASYEVTSLSSDENVIKVNDEVQDLTRSYLDATIYNFASVDANEENNEIGENGVVTGTAVVNMDDIKYYYSIETLNVTGEVIGGNGTITGVPQEVEHSGSTSEKIVIKPNDGYKVSSIRMYTGSEVDGDYDETDGVNITAKGIGKITQSKTYNGFSNITKNIHIVAKFAEANFVAKIVGVPGNDETLAAIKSNFGVDDGVDTVLNHRYTTLEDAINDAQKVNDANTEGIEGTVKIVILEDIDGEINEINNQNYVTIDLNGHTIALTNDESGVITVKNGGKLTLVNTGSETNSETGKDSEIVNLDGTSVYVQAGGELTLGLNDGRVSTTTPTIEGNETAGFGIYLEEGSTLNFYDGKVVGNKDSAIVNKNNNATINAPELYEVTIQANGEKEVAFVAIPSGYEAMIGKIKYETLELAFQAVENNTGYGIDTPVEIDVIAQVTLENPITLSSNKNVVLDLNGNKINEAQANYMFVNNGKLEIKDSTADVSEEYVYAELVKNGEYYFERVDDHLEASNYGKANSRANSYIEIDLSAKPETYEYVLAVDANVSSESAKDYGYITVTESTDAPVATATEGRMAYVSGITLPTQYTKKLVGGKKYYLHLGYSKNADTDRYLDTFIINDITLDGQAIIKELVNGQGAITNPNYGTIKNEATGTLTIASGNVVGTANRNGDNYATVQNLGTLAITGGRITGANYDTIVNSGTANITGGIITGGRTHNYENGKILFDKTVRTYTGSLQGVWSYGELTINNGTFSTQANNTNGSVALYGSKKSEINEGRFISLGVGITVSSADADVVINNADIRANTGINYSGKMYIKDADIKIYGDRGIQAGSYEADITVDHIVVNGIGIGIGASSGTDRTRNIVINDAEINTTGKAIDNELSKTTIIVNDGTYTSSTDSAVYNKAGTTTLSGGTFIAQLSDKAAVYNESGITNIGIKNTVENKEVSTITPTLKSEGTGVVNGLGGTVNFYDGQIISAVDDSIRGTLTSIEEVDGEGNDLNINISKIVEDEKEYDRMILLPENTSVARILKSTAGINVSSLSSSEYSYDDTYYYFKKLQSAIDVCSSSAGDTITTIEIIHDITTIKSLQVAEGKNIKLDLNGYNIDFLGSETAITNNGKLDIENSSEVGEITGRSTILNNTDTMVINANITDMQKSYGSRLSSRQPVYNLILNSGKLTLNGGTITGYYKTVVNNVNEFEMNGGRINALNVSWGVANTGTAKCTVNAGTIYGEGSAYYSNDLCCIANLDTATVKINGGTFSTSSVSTIYNNSTSMYEEGVSEPAIYITGGSFSPNTHIIESSLNYTTEIWIIKDDDAELSLNKSIQMNGKLRIEGATISGAVTNYYGASIIKDSTITGRYSNYSNESPETITTITNSTIGSITENRKEKMLIKDSTINSGISNVKEATITIENSEIKGTVDNYSTGTINIPSVGNTVIKTGGNAIYNRSTGTITIGTADDGTVSTEYPQITGSTYGVNNESRGTINFYDGIITGATNQSIKGTVTDVEDGYDIIKTTDTTKRTESAVLMKLIVAKILKSDISSSNLSDIVYTDNDDDYYGFYELQDAFKACSDNIETSVIVCRDITYTSKSTSQELLANKKVVLDVSGYTISSGMDNTFILNGNMKIIDSSVDYTGKITTSGNNLMTNNGTLTIENVTLTSTKAGENIEENYTVVIDNKGTMNLNSITANMSADNMYFIKNSGTCNISEGTYNGSAQRILTRNLLYNTGNAYVNGSKMISSGIYNYDLGTVELIDVNANEFEIRNYGTSEYLEGVSKPAIRITGGSYYIAHNAYSSSYGYSLINYNGELIIEDNQNSEGKSLIYGGNRYGSDGLISNENGKVTINSGIFKDFSFSNKDIFNINGGSIKNINVTNNGTMNVGINDGDIINDKPLFEESSITNNNEFNYYDGTIKVSGIAVKPTISNIATNATIIHTVEDNLDVYTLSKNETIATIGDNEFNSLKAAFDACTTSNNTVINLQKSIAMIDGQELAIQSNQNITLNLNGNSIIGNCTNVMFTNEGTFEITDDSSVGDGYIRSYSNGMIENTGNIKISGGTLTTESTTNRIIINNEGTGTVEVTGGTFNTYAISSDSSVQTKVINSTGTGNITVTGGTFNCSGERTPGYCICVLNENSENKPTVIIGGDMLINSASQSSYVNYGYYVQNADVTVTGGTNKASNNALVNSDIIYTGGTTTGIIDVNANSSLKVTGNSVELARIINSGNVEMTAGTIKGILTNSGTATVKNVEFTGSGAVNNSSTVTIEDTTFNVTGNAITTSSNGNTTLSKNVSITTSGGVGITSSAGTTSLQDNITVVSETGNAINITGGTVEIPYLTPEGEVNTTTITSNSAIGIYQTNGALTLGTNEYPVYKTYPQVTGKTYGLQVTRGTFNFYDGILKGENKAFSGTITNSPELYTLLYDDSTETTAYLGIEATVENVVQVGEGFKYSSLTSAINVIKNSGGTGTITFLKNTTISEPIIIPSDANITFDMRGLSLRYSGESATIINNGILVIIDGVTSDTDSTYGFIENVQGAAIQNNGTLTIGKEDDTLHITSPRIIGKTYAIKNGDTATLNLYDGVLEGVIAPVDGTITISENCEIVDGTDSRTIGSDIFTYLTKYLKNK